MNQLLDHVYYYLYSKLLIHHMNLSKKIIPSLLRFKTKAILKPFLVLVFLQIGSINVFAQFEFDVSRAVYTGINESFSVRNQEAGPTSMKFNANGTKMFVLGSNGDNINQYSLSIAYDVSTAVFDDIVFSVREQEPNPYSLVFNNDGTKMYITGESNDNINQYSLATPYDVSTATYDGDEKRFNVGNQDNTPTDIAFNTNGTKLFVLGFGTDYVYEYTLSVAFDVSTAVYDGNEERFQIVSQENSPFAVAFNPDGTKMFVMGRSGDDINQYTLSTGFDVSTAEYDGDGERFYIGSEETDPWSLTFNTDGTKMFVLGRTNDTVFEYSLLDFAPQINGTIAGQLVNDRATVKPFSGIIINEPNDENVSATISLDNNAKGVLTGTGLTGTGPYTIAETTPESLQTILSDLLFDPTDDRVSGGATETTFFTLNVSDGNNTTSNSATTTITTTNPSVSSIEVTGDPDSFDASIDFTVTFVENVTGVDITDFTLNTSLSVSAILTDVNGSDNIYTVTVSTISGHGTLSVDLLSNGTGIQDGSGNPITGGFEGDIHAVGFAFDLVNGPYAGDDQRLGVGNQEGTPHDIVFTNNGFKMLLIGSGADAIIQYNLSTAYDVSTAVFDVGAGTFSVSAQESNPYGMAFNNDGTKMFIVGDNDFVNQYTLSIPYNPSTAIYDGDGERFSVSSQETAPSDLAFNPDGTKLFILGFSGDDISQYTRSSPFDVSTGIYDGDSERLPLIGQESTPRSFVFAFNGKKLYVVGNSGDDVNPYTLSTPYDLSTAVFDGNDQRLFLNSLDSNPFGLVFNPDGTKLFIVGDANNAIYEFSMFDVAPEISKTITGQEVNDRSTVSPFEEIVIIEGNNQDVSATITLDDNAKGVLTGTGLTGTGPYNIAATTDDDLQGILREILFNPTDDRVISGVTETTTFTLTINDGTFISNDNTTTTETTTDPKVLSITLVGDPSPADTEVDFLVTFAEDVTGVDISDFTLNTSEAVTASLTGFSGSGNLYTLTVSAISGIGVVDLDFSEDETEVLDLAANSIVGGFDTGEILYTDYSYDVSNAIYEGDDARLFVRNEEGTPRSMLFNPNGTKMFIIGSSEDAVSQYTLSEAYDVSSAVFDNIRFSIRTNTNEINPTDMAFNEDGTKMFVIGINNQTIYQYTLGIPYDVSSVTYDGINESFSVSNQETSPTDIAFNIEGTKLFVLGDSGNDISQYTLSYPFDISTAVFDGNEESFPVGGQESQPQSMVFNLDGTKMYVTGRSGDDVNSYTLSNPFDVSTADFDGNTERYNFRDQGSINTYSLTFKPDGSKMFMMDISSDFVYEYNLFNVDPEIADPIVRVEALEDNNFNFDVPENTFNDQNQSTVFTYEATMQGGGDFPDWLIYDEIANNFSGTPTNDDVSNFTVELTATDDLGVAVTDVFELEVINTNDPPILDPILDQITDEGAILAFQTSFTDVDVGDTFSWMVDEVSRNKGVTIFNNGEVNWTPGENVEGANTVTVTVTDSEGASSSQTLTITVNEVDNAPVISQIEEKEVIAPNTLIFDVNAIDPDPVPQTLSYSIDDTSIDKGMAIDAVTGAFSWSVDNNDIGFHEVKVDVSDGILAASRIVTIRVREENVAPILASIANQTVNTFTTLTFTVTATDSNPGETLTFSLSGSELPTGIQFDEMSGVFIWTPRESQIGLYELTISVTDGLASDAETFSIEVARPLSVEDDELNDDIQVYPNPVLKELVIEFEDEENGLLLIQLYDLEGKLMKERKITKPHQKITTLLDVTEIADGLYILDVIFNGKQKKEIKILKKK